MESGLFIGLTRLCDCHCLYTDTACQGHTVVAVSRTAHEAVSPCRIPTATQARAFTCLAVDHGVSRRAQVHEYTCLAVNHGGGDRAQVHAGVKGVVEVALLDDRPQHVEEEHGGGEDEALPRVDVATLDERDEHAVTSYHASKPWINVQFK